MNDLLLNSRLVILLSASLILVVYTLNANNIYAQQKVCPNITTKTDCVKFRKCKWAQAKNKCIGKKANTDKSKKKKCISLGTRAACKAQNRCKWIDNANRCTKK